MFLQYFYKLMEVKVSFTLSRMLACFLQLVYYRDHKYKNHPGSANL